MLTTTLAQGGIGALFVGVIGWMWRMIVLSDRRQAVELARVNADHDVELAQLRESRDNELRRMGEQVAALTERVRQLEIRLDAEREARRAAEDRAAAAERRSGGSIS